MTLSPQSSRASRGWTAFWLWYVLAGALLLVATKGQGLGPLSMGLLWWLGSRYPTMLRRLGRAVPGPPFVRFMLVGLLSTDVVMENLAISFHGDLDANLLVNSFLWLGAYSGALIGWWGVTRLYAFSVVEVFIAYGLKGAVVEQSFLIPRQLQQGQLLSALVGLPIILVTYGASIALVFLAVPETLRGTRRPGVLGWILALTVPALLFYLGHAGWMALLRHH